MKTKIFIMFTAAMGLGLVSCSKKAEENAGSKSESSPGIAQVGEVSSGSEVDTATFRRLVAEERRVVMVDFHAEWCGPCKTLAPTLEKVAAAHADEVLLIKVNVDNNKELAREKGVRSIPFVQFYKGGEAVDQFVGVVSEGEVEALVKKHAGGA